MENEILEESCVLYCQGDYRTLIFVFVDFHPFQVGKNLNFFAYFPLQTLLCSHWQIPAWMSPAWVEVNLEGEVQVNGCRRRTKKGINPAH